MACNALANVRAGGEGGGISGEHGEVIEGGESAVTSAIATATAAVGGELLRRLMN